MNIEILQRNQWREVEKDLHLKGCLVIFKNDKKHRVNHQEVKSTSILRSKDISIPISISYSIINKSATIITLMWEILKIIITQVLLGQMTIHQQNKLINIVTVIEKFMGEMIMMIIKVQAIYWKLIQGNNCSNKK